jgi:membrane protease YdiL (CAAX protease family)
VTDLLLAAAVFAGIVAWQRLVAAVCDGRWDYVRPLLYVAPALLYVLLRPTPPGPSLGVVEATIIGVVAVVVVWAGSARQLRSAVDLALLGLPPITAKRASLRILNLIGGPLVQEPVYRAVLLWPLTTDFGMAVAVVVTSALFAGEHRLHRNAHAYRRRDYARQFAFGLLFGVLSLASGSVLPSLFAHLSWNLPTSFVVVLRALVSARSDQLSAASPGNTQAKEVI